MNRQDTLAQMQFDDTPIGERPYPSGRPDSSPLPDVEVSWSGSNVGDNGLFLTKKRQADVEITKSEPRAKRVEARASSEIEIVPSNIRCKTAKPERKPELPASPLREMSVQISFYLPKGTDITKGAPKKNAKPVYQHIPLDTTKVVIDTSNPSFTNLKDCLFVMASTIAKDVTEGNTAILKLADASKAVKITCYIPRHNFYGTGHARLLTNTTEVEGFFLALPNGPTGHCGLVVAMDNPTKSALAASTELTMSQARMTAQRKLNSGLDSTPGDLAHAAPLDPKKEFVTALQTRHGSHKNNQGEGLRIFNPDDLTQKMELTYRHLLIWADVWAKGDHPDVSVDVPPLHLEEDFAWISVLKVAKKKKTVNQTPPNSNVNATPLASTTIIGSPISNTTPASPINHTTTDSTVTTPTPAVTAQGHKYTSDSLTFPIGSVAEMQGHAFNIDYKTLRRILWHPTLEDYFKFCEIDPDQIEEDVKNLKKQGIKSFHRFLFPDSLSADKISSWGILYDTAMELQARAREFYVYQVALDDERAEWRKQREEDARFLREHSLMSKMRRMVDE